CLYLQDDPEKQKLAMEIFNIVFFVVLSSLLVQSKTLMHLANWLDLSEAAKSKSRAPLEFEETGLSTSRMYEFEITENSPSAGLTIKDLNLPENVLVYLIKRDGIFIVPRGGTIIQIDDELLMMMDPHLAPGIEPLFLASKETPVTPI
ncbi:MAG: TrkA C-terminal domain-containing protein, partial [Planctomycetia bacterium]|nr:TrkA C-terminal domain-containing protein [Planctomycetia bacterium]